MVLLKKFKMTSCFFNIEIITYWINLDQPELTCQIRNLGYETIIIIKNIKINYET